MIGLTHQQRKCLDVITSYQRANGGVSPSFNEMAAGLGIASKGRIHEILNGLQERGHIRWLRSRQRAIEVLTPRAGKPVVTYTNAAYFKWDEESQGLKPWQADQKTS